MVNIAFVISLVASAVFLIVSIAIFSDVVEAMQLTLPVGTTGVESNIDNEWSFREQSIAATGNAKCEIEQIDPTTDMSTTITGLLDMDSGNSVNDRSHCFIYKTFDKSDVQNKILNVTWAGTASVAMAHRIMVFDGEYLRNNNTDFPLDLSFGFNVAKGGYKLHEIVNGGCCSFATETKTLNMTLVGSTLPQVTVAIGFQDTSVSNILTLDLFNATVDDTALWDFTDNSGTTFTQEVFGTNGGDYGFFSTGLTNLQASQGTPLTPSQQQQVESFNNARAIGFTVIGIMPIALFFGLFTILSPRLE